MTDLLTRRWFGTDGIRGRANEELTVDVAVKLGQAAGQHFKNGDHRHTVLIAKDPRLSSYMIEMALASGFMSAGMDVQLTGPMPTPAVALLTRSMRADLGVMISASHNLYQDNGIKLFDRKGAKLSDAVEIEIEERMQSPELHLGLAKGSEIGRADRIGGAQERYIELVKSTIPKSFDLIGMRIVIDCANGAGYSIGPRLLRELGAEVIAIGVNPNGTNINHDCGSTSPAQLAHKVRQVRADIGIALDGDADRVMIVDEKGVIVDGDQIVALIAEKWLELDRLKGGNIVTTETSNFALEKYLATKGIGVIRTRVGDRYVLEAMRESSCNIGGESSGHIAISDFSTTGDGLVAALQVLFFSKGKVASEELHRFTPLPQFKADFAHNGTKVLESEAAQELIATATATLEATGGRILVRKSGTEPLIRVLGEGEDLVHVRTVVSELTSSLKLLV